MKGFPYCVAGAGLVVLGVLVALTAELLGGWLGPGARAAVYAGGAAGMAVTLLGWPFVLKLQGLAASPAGDPAFWKWWGGGILVRLAVLLALAFGLAAHFRQEAAAALLALGGVYVLGLFAEAGWLATRLFTVTKN